MNEQPTHPGGAGESRPTPTQSLLRDSLANATARIQTIIETAEQAAAGIVDDAEVQARRYLDESRVRADQISDQRSREMSSLTDSLIEQAETVKRQSDELLRSLGQAKQRAQEQLRDESATIVQPAESSPAQSIPVAPSEPAAVHHLKPAEPPTGQAETVAPGGNPPSDGARLLATQMAVAGNSRAEIESCLQNEFGIWDAGPMLDAILGREV